MDIVKRKNMPVKYVKWNSFSNGECKSMLKIKEIKTCNFFNSNKTCPYYNIGCKFKHEKAVQCKFAEKLFNDKVSTQTWLDIQILNTSFHSYMLTWSLYF